MPEVATPKFLTQAEFARRRKVARKTVTDWKKKGLLVQNEDGKIDVEATEWKLDDRPATYRGGSTHRPIRAPDGNNATQAAAKPKTVSRPVSRPSVLPSDDSAEPIDFDDPNLPMAEAVRRKENFLGLTRKHEFEVEKSKWALIEDVAREVEKEYAVVRERLLAIPGKMASRIEGLDRTAIELALLDEITETLNELHAPDAGDGFADAA